MTARTDELSERFSEWLDRYSPPRHFAGNAKAMQAEADALLGVLARYAPKEGYASWVVDVLGRLSAGMKTRAWPTVAEMTEACRARVSVVPGSTNDELVEENCLRIMTEWFERKRNQMPSMGRTDRTRKLIDRGVLADEREARFYGFNLSEEDDRKAHSQKMGREEWNHHCRVLARLRGCTWQEAADAERRREPVEMPDFKPKRMDTAAE
jgi:hypothetical protein